MYCKHCFHATVADTVILIETLWPMKPKLFSILAFHRKSLLLLYLDDFLVPLLIPRF